MQNSKAYDCLIKQLNANGSEKMDGYYPKVMEEIYDWEREEVEDIIWDAFFNKNEIELAQFFPKLKKYDGIKALKESPYLLQIPSEASVEIGKILYEATGDDGYLDIIKKNIDASPETISFVSILSYCKPCQRLYNILVDIYINNSNKVNRSTAVMGILYNKGIIKDRSSIKESNDVISLRKKFKSEDSIEREKILEKFEAVCAMFALDLIGVKVFGYSDETAEAVASGEKLLKESETIYESFADMMSPEDAKRYLDFLENGSREGLTSAELADALLVSQKVGYEDVWDLRNPCDVLESGKYSILSYEDAENIAFDAIHGPNNADAVVLGKYGDGGPTAYTSVAKDMDAQYFQLDNWDELAARYSDDEIWKINEKFLDIQTSSGREIYLSHNPEEYLGKEQFYSRELQYLLDNGYKFVDEGGIWHAVR